MPGTMRMSLQKTNVEEIRTALVRIRVSEVSETSSKAAEPGSTATMVLTASPHQKPLCSTDAGRTATDIHQHLQACAMATALNVRYRKRARQANQPDKFAQRPVLHTNPFRQAHRKAKNSLVLGSGTIQFGPSPRTVTKMLGKRTCKVGRL